MGEQAQGGEPASQRKSLTTPDVSLRHDDPNASSETDTLSRITQVYNRHRLTVIACSAVILARSRPATWPRRFAFLGVGFAAHTASDYMRLHSDSSLENVRVQMKASLGLSDGANANKARPAFRRNLWTHTHRYLKDDDSASLARQTALEKLRAHLSGSEDPDLVLRYLERERIRDSRSTLGERFAFKWYNLWSSFDTRAAIDDVMSIYLAELKSRFETEYQIPLSIEVPECDFRHFVSYTGSMLEYKLLAGAHALPSVVALDCSVFAGMFFSNPWAVYTAAFVGLGSVAWYLGYAVRRTQHVEGPLRYGNQRLSPWLHLHWYDWAVLDGKWLKCQTLALPVPESPSGYLDHQRASR